MIEDSLHLNSTVDDNAQQETESKKAMPEISFHAIARSNHPQSIRVMGKLKNKNRTVLIDGGSTHNFTDQVIVTKYGLHVTRYKKFQVMLAN